MRQKIDAIKLTLTIPEVEESKEEKKRTEVETKDSEEFKFQGEGGEYEEESSEDPFTYMMAVIHTAKKNLCYELEYY